MLKQIDTLAGEFDAETNYLYTTYHGQSHDVGPLPKTPIIILGSGPYCIGSSVEFDWCAVNTAVALRKLDRPTIMINSNPETVSTDFDRSDRLYFEELSFERVCDIADFEQEGGIIISVGGQAANNLALPLHQAGYNLLGTSGPSIDQAENRKKFSHMLGELGVDQPTWESVTSVGKAKAFAKRVGYPVLIRPSYVLSGAAMSVVTSEHDLSHYLEAATKLSPDHPVVISQFITNAKELEIDGVAQNGRIIIQAISEHIENAGVHSGDATVVLPPQHLYLETIRRAKRITKQIASQLQITGPFNIQFIAKDNAIKVIECNLRASRSFPFVSKVTGHNFIAMATRAIMGLPLTENHHTYETLELDYVAVKSPQFSYHRLKGADPVAGVEMASTGEVACFGDNLREAFYLSWLATEQSVKGKRLLISLAEAHRPKFIQVLTDLAARGWDLSATIGTHQFFNTHGISSCVLYKISEQAEPSVTRAIQEGELDLIISVPPSTGPDPDGFALRRLAIDNHLPLITNAETGRLLLQCLDEFDNNMIEPKSWQEFMDAMAA